MLVSLDPVSEAIVHVMRMNDYQVEVTQEGETYGATATHPDGERHAAEGADLYLTICALAEKVGVELASPSPSSATRRLGSRRPNQGSSANVASWPSVVARRLGSSPGKETHGLPLGWVCRWN